MFIITRLVISFKILKSGLNFSLQNSFLKVAMFL